MNQAEQKCGNCRYYLEHPADAQWGHCRIRSVASFPCRKPSEWCGEWCGVEPLVRPSVSDVWTIQHVPSDTKVECGGGGGSQGFKATGETVVNTASDADVYG